MTLASTGKSALIAAGAGLGLLHSLRIIGNLSQSAARMGTLEARVDTLHVAVARLADQTQSLQCKVDERVTKAEVNQAIRHAFDRLERGVDDRFDRQTRSVEALRLMVGQTDELLQRVLDGLQAFQQDAAGPA